MFVVGGFEGARAVIARQFEPVLKTVDPKTLGKDSKTLVQEFLQGKRLPLPVYTVVETRGAAHNQEFEVECAIPKLEVAVRGVGRRNDPVSAKPISNRRPHGTADRGRVGFVALRDPSCVLRGKNTHTAPGA